MNDERKTIDVTWVLVVFGLAVLGMAGYTTWGIVGAQRALEQQQAEREAAQQRRLQHTVDGIEEGPAEMLIDFGDIQLNCAKQNLLGYEVENPQGAIVVGSNSIVFTMEGPPLDSHYVRAPILDVTADVFSEIGMQYNITTSGPLDVGFECFGGFATVGATVLGAHTSSTGLPYLDYMTGYYKNNPVESYQFAPDTKYTVQHARYLDDDVYHAVTRILIGESVEATIATEDGDDTDYLGYTNVYIYPFTGSGADIRTATVSNVYVSGASPVLPQIRNTPNLGKLLIRPGGNT